mgnify:CR=1 FL=1
MTTQIAASPESRAAQAALAMHWPFESMKHWPQSASLAQAAPAPAFGVEVAVETGVCVGGATVWVAVATEVCVGAATVCVAVRVAVDKLFHHRMS